MSSETKTPKMKVWWIPQMPMKAFEVYVASIEEAAKIMDVLANYDLFQLEHNLKDDYANIGGLQVFENGEWLDWEDPETGEQDPKLYLDKIREAAQ